MVNKSEMFFGLIVFGIILFSLGSVSSLGVTPGRTSFNFEPGLSKDVSFSVINTQQKDMNVYFIVRGDLAEYVTFDSVSASLSSREESKSFVYHLRLPDKIEKPGKYETEIIIMETIEGDKELVGATVGGTVAVISQLHVYVPYPGKYVEAEVNVIENNGLINFVLPVTNRGKLDIVDLKANIDVFDGADNKIVTLETKSQTLNSGERKELFSEWNPQVNPGRYRAVASVRYDDNVATVLKEFNVGEKFLEILEVNVRDFELGDIAKFDALVENKWSSDLRDVYLNILVYNNEGEIMADFKSPTYDIDALSKAEMIAYWDTAGVHEGTYDGKLMLKYGEKATERNIQMKIGIDSIEVVGLTGKVLVKGGGGSLNWNVVLIAIVAVLVVANVIWFVLIRKILKKKR